MKIEQELLRDLMALLQRHRIPLQHGVSLICRIKGMTLNQLAAASGYHRNSIYKALSGENQVQTEMEVRISQILGINPWDYSALNRKENCT